MRARPTTAYIQPHGVLLIARQSDLRFVYVSANAERVTRIAAGDMLGKSILDCLSAEICSKIIHYDNRKKLVFDLARRRSVVSGVGTRHHVEVLHHDGLIYIEMELEIVEPEADRLPVQAQMVLDRVRATTSMEDLLSTTTKAVRELTGYARVMVYKFERDGHGQVIAEDRAKGMVPFRNLHFPVADIPLPVRERSLKHPIRMIANTRYEPVPVLKDPALDDDAPMPDMSVCGLRSGSPVQLDYVRKMGAGAVLMLSLIVDGELWGLLICHHTAPKLPSPEMRSTCELLSQIVSALIRQRQDAGLQAEVAARDTALHAIAAAFEERDSAFDSLLASQEQVLRLVRASGALIRMQGESQLLGIAPSLAEASEILKAVRIFAGDNLFHTDNLSEVVPEVTGSDLGTCGALMLPLAGQSGDGILWFRPEFRKAVTWGGRLGKKVIADSRTGNVFAKRQLGRWETVETEHSLPWENVDLDGAISLGRLVTAQVAPQSVPSNSRAKIVDAATKPAGRSEFEARLQDWAHAPTDEAATVVLIGIDHFNLVDVAYGRSIGEQLVQQIAKRVTGIQWGESVAFARLQANTFGLFCACGPEAEAQRLMDELTVALEQPFEIQGKPFHASTRLAWAHSDDGRDEALLRKAETALEFARNGGKRSAKYNSWLHAEVTRRMQLEQDLYNACAEEQFYLLYQPIVSLPAGELVGFEALLRWNHPQRGIISPVEFIPLAEAEGLMPPIGEWVFAKALRQLGAWTDLCGPRLKVHVNVAAQQLAEAGLPQFVSELLLESDLPGSVLSLEVSEATLVMETAAQRLQEMRSLGITVAADDFGTGYSSLASLRKLPLDIVKVDKEFVQSIPGDPRSKDFVSTIFQLARTMGLHAIGKGVETEEQAAILTELGCPAAQGFYYSVPLTRDEATQLIERCKDNAWLVLPVGQLMTNAA